MPINERNKRRNTEKASYHMLKQKQCDDKYEKETWYIKTVTHERMKRKRKNKRSRKCIKYKVTESELLAA